MTRYVEKIKLCFFSEMTRKQYIGCTSLLCQHICGHLFQRLGDLKLRSFIVAGLFGIVFLDLFEVTITPH